VGDMAGDVRKQSAIPPWHLRDSATGMKHLSENRAVQADPFIPRLTHLSPASLPGAAVEWLDRWLLDAHTHQLNPCGQAQRTVGDRTSMWIRKGCGIDREFFAIRQSI
jgi:hypothetical protein